MNFDEFKEQYRKIAGVDGIVVTDDELAKLFIAQVVIADYQQKEMKKKKKRMKKAEGLSTIVVTLNADEVVKRLSEKLEEGVKELSQ